MRYSVDGLQVAQSLNMIKLNPILSIKKSYCDKKWTLLFIVLTIFSFNIFAQQSSWDWANRKNCPDCRLSIKIINPEVDSVKIREYVHAIGIYKKGLRTIYSYKRDQNLVSKISSDEYNMIAGIAFGILGNESRFYESPKFQLKEAFPGIVTKIKAVNPFKENKTVNSRGPTQIKVIPTKISETYGFTPEDLIRPDVAAVSTMAFLIEIYLNLKQQVIHNNLSFINQENFADYIPYFYYGNGKEVLKGNPTPFENRYVLNIKRYQSWIELYESDY